MADPTQTPTSGAIVAGQAPPPAADRDPNTGELYLTSAPGQDMSAGGAASQWAANNAFNAFVKQFNRNPTQSELSMLAPSYAAGDRNIASNDVGNAAVAQYYNKFANSPDNIAKNKQTQNQAAAPKYYDQVNQMFQSSLGRDATQDEKDHFGGMLASGTTDAYTVGQFLTALPEAVQKQDATFRNNLNTTLQSQDSQYYKEQILPALQSQAVKSGRSLDSSGVENATALAAQKQNTDREGFLTGLTADQYRNSQGLAQDAYQKAYGAQADLASYSRQRSDYLTDAYTNRTNSVNDYNIQKQAYDQYLQRYGKRNSGVGALAGGLVGAGIGAYAGGPVGASVGYQVGSGAGSFFG